jgi:hypothetical protein
MRRWAAAFPKGNGDPFSLPAITTQTYNSNNFMIQREGA